MIPEKTFNKVSQLSHVAWGAWLPLLALWFLGPKYMNLIMSVSILLAALKEFVYDLLVETEEVSGGLWGGVEDFSFYLLGIALTAMTMAIKL